MKWISALAICSALTFVGCGSSEDSDGEAEESAASEVEEANETGPRVEGVWRLVLTANKGNFSEDRFTWDVTPECATGACSFRVDSRTTGNKLRYRFDQALGDYTHQDRYTDDCRNIETNEIVIADAYTVRTTDRLNVVDSVISDEDGVDYAIEMFGTSEEEQTITPEAAGTCKVQSPSYSMHLIREDAPEGEPGSAAAPVEGAEGEGLPPEEGSAPLPGE